MNKIVTAFVAALLLVIPVAALAQAAPLTATLEGSASDWSVLSDNGSTVILSSPKYGAKASSYRYYRFADDRYIVRDRRIVPTFALPSASGFTQADLDKARADGRAEGIAAVRAALAGVR